MPSRNMQKCRSKWVWFGASGFRWSFFGFADVSVEISLSMTFLFLTPCLATVWWIFKTGYRLKN